VAVRELQRELVSTLNIPADLLSVNEDRIKHQRQD
jgi:hypothetical protein